MTKLHEALEAAGVKSLSYTDTKSDVSIDIPLADVPEETIISQLEYGRRMFNDRLNSMEGDRSANRAKLEARLVAGWTRTHGGGKRLDTVEREAREVVVALMVEAKFKATEARKLVSADGAEAAFRANIADIDEKWAAVYAHAEKVAAMKATLPAIA